MVKSQTACQDFIKSVGATAMRILKKTAISKDYEGCLDGAARAASVRSIVRKNTDGGRISTRGRRDSVTAAFRLPLQPRHQA